MSVAPKKSLGQHFLTDPNTVRKIADAVGAPAGAPVVEIGPGTGALTGALLERYPALVAVEVDERAVEHLREKHPALDVRHEDVLETDWRALAAERGSALWVVGNLPYYITSPILFSLIDAREALARAVVMMQLEVAERLVAAPGTKAYGILSVQTQLFARPRLLFKVSRNVFFPRPDVESAVVGLDFRSETGALEGVPMPGVDEAALRRLVRTAFGQRRKMMRNSLAGLAAEGGTPLPEAYAERRPETLTPAEFVALARALAGGDEG